MNLTTRQLTVTGILGAVAIVLSVTPLGYVPVPTPAGSATIMHIPVIIGAIIEGPIVGGFVGLIFGITSFLRGGAFFVDPLIAILPRVLIGLGAGYIYQLIDWKVIASIVAAIVGSLVNTGGVLMLAVLRGYLNQQAAWGVALTHGLPEIIIAFLVTVAVVKVLQTADLGVKNLNLSN